MTPDEKPELDSVKIHRAVWQRFRRAHRITDGLDAYHGRPHTPLIEALSLAVTRVLDLMEAEYTEYIHSTHSTGLKPLAIPAEDAKLDS